MGNLNVERPGNSDFEGTEPSSATPASDSLHATETWAWLPFGNGTVPSQRGSAPARAIGDRWSAGCAVAPGAPVNLTMNSPRTASSLPPEMSDVRAPAVS